MSEHAPKNEAARSHAETLDHHEAQKNHHERAEKHREKAVAKAENGHMSHEHIQRTVEAEAISGAEYHKPQAEQRQHTTPTTKLDKERGFNTIMHQTQNKMSRPERTFSRLIHQPVVEKASEVIGATVARPSGIIGATAAAFIGLLSIYGIAKFAGFQLSGSEAPLLLGIGFILGLFIEWCIKSLLSLFGNRK